MSLIRYKSLNEYSEKYTTAKKDNGFSKLVH